MTNDQLDDAIAQMVSHCRLSFDQYKAGIGDYEGMSARGVLYTLGFEEDQADEVLQDISNRGFNYCLDPAIPDHDGKRPPRFATEWGVDQLLSRLQCLSSRRKSDD